MGRMTQPTVSQH